MAATAWSGVGCCTRRTNNGTAAADPNCCGPAAAPRARDSRNGTWTKSVLHGNANRLVVYLDTDRNGTIDYHARVKESGGKLYAVIAGSGSSFEPLPAHKPNGRTVRFTIPGNSPPNPNGTGPQIRAYSKFTQSVQCDTASGHPPCIDRAPNTGWI